MTEQEVVNKKKIAFRDPTTALYLCVLKILVKTDCLSKSFFFFLRDNTIVYCGYFVDSIYI